MLQHPNHSTPTPRIPPHATKVFSGQIFDVYQWQQPLFDNSLATFEALKRTGTVCVIPILDDGQILLTDQEQPDRGPFIGTAGGRVEPGEAPEQAALRELEEETGYTADKLELFDIAHPTGKIDWQIYTFLAKGCHKVSDPRLEAGERIKTFTGTFDEFVKLLAQDNFRDKEIVLKILKAKERGELEQVRKQFSNP